MPTAIGGALTPRPTVPLWGANRWRGSNGERATNRHQPNVAHAARAQTHARHANRVSPRVMADRSTHSRTRQTRTARRATRQHASRVSPRRKTSALNQSWEAEQAGRVQSTPAQPERPPDTSRSLRSRQLPPLTAAATSPCSRTTYSEHHDIHDIAATPTSSRLRIPRTVASRICSDDSLCRGESHCRGTSSSGFPARSALQSLRRKRTTTPTSSADGRIEQRCSEPDRREPRSIREESRHHFAWPKRFVPSWNGSSNSSSNRPPCDNRTPDPCRETAEICPSSRAPGPASQSARSKSQRPPTPPTGGATNGVEIVRRVRTSTVSDITIGTRFNTTATTQRATFPVQTNDSLPVATLSTAAASLNRARKTTAKFSR